MTKDVDARDEPAHDELGCGVYNFATFTCYKINDKSHMTAEQKLMPVDFLKKQVGMGKIRLALRRQVRVCGVGIRR